MKGSEAGWSLEAKQARSVRYSYEDSYQTKKKKKVELDQVSRSNHQIKENTEDRGTGLLHYRTEVGKFQTVGNQYRTIHQVLQQINCKET